MKIEEILFAEKKGIIDTINDYTREHFIRNYTALLDGISYPKDKEKLIMILYRLLEWYEKNYSEIMSNQYINNKHEHTRSMKLIQKLISQLHS